jgi:hypothetical protein
MTDSACREHRWQNSWNRPQLPSETQLAQIFHIVEQTVAWQLLRCGQNT